MALQITDSIYVLDPNKNGVKNVSYLIYNVTQQREQTISPDELRNYLLVNKSTGRSLSCNTQIYQGKTIIRIDDTKLKDNFNQLKTVLTSSSIDRVLARISNVKPKQTQQKQETKTSSISNKESAKTDKEDLDSTDLRKDREFILSLLSLAYNSLGATIRAKVSPSGEVLYQVESNCESAISKLILSKNRIEYCLKSEWGELKSINQLAALIVSSLAIHISNNSKGLDKSSEEISKKDKEISMLHTMVNTANNTIDELKAKEEELTAEIVKLKSDKLDLEAERNSLMDTKEKLENKLLSINTSKLEEDNTQTKINTQEDNTNESDLNTLMAKALINNTDENLSENQEIEEPEIRYQESENQEESTDINNDSLGSIWATALSPDFETSNIVADNNTQNKEQNSNVSDTEDNSVYHWSLDGDLQDDEQEGLEFEDSNITKINFTDYSEIRDTLKIEIYTGNSTIDKYLTPEMKNELKKKSINIVDDIPFTLSIPSRALHDDIDNVLESSSSLLTEIITNDYNNDSSIKISIQNTVNKDKELLRIKADAIIQYILTNVQNLPIENNIIVETTDISKI